MASTQAPEKPISEKHRIKLEKFAQKKARQAQHQSNTTPKEKKPRKLDALAINANDWVDETPPGHKKILKSLDDDFLKAYVPNVVESSWYSFWEEQGLFKPRTNEDGSLKPKGSYVIAIPPPNVRNKVSKNWKKY